MTDSISILWTSNIVLPAVAALLGVPETPFGGWLSVTTSRLAQVEGLRIGVAMRAPVSGFQHVHHEGIDYFAVPQARGDLYDVAQADCDRALTEFSPDILHVEGTEMAYTRRFLSSWQGRRLISLQGVINGCKSYQFGHLKAGDFLNPQHPQHALVGLALLANNLVRFRPRLHGERETIAMADHILGRTIWDRAQANWLNPTAQYHHCPRILREPFYEKTWSRDTCEPFSIFVGNGASALKGAHFAVQALALIRRSFPKAKLYIAGRNPWSLSRLSAQRLIGYSVYLMDLISDLGLRDHVVFTGQLDAEQMAERMRRAHVVALASLIENSPNTLAEAMMMGVPAVSSYAGGVPSMAQDGEEALFYRAGDPVMLAWQVQRLFADDSLADRVSQAARARAAITHDPQNVVDTLVRTYRAVSKVRPA
ncbi:glycosyltransferase family 4 protein [Roseicyclus sp. F158]|uniref:Glycosyltransferase family 4 protein n=1 Tax=Tropicimonas omnivorans TaxID=3075590 RepID=A0ABU3DLG0_9RHOB|nr:glycosyltransferase family 4 protein [Roseicyclus sp. F158]MDT0684535.1 glycosyltransferase family 4 protein [Roseicyclus sp. F158]